MSDEAFARRLLLRPRGAARPRRPAPVPARRVHRRGAVHAPLRALLPAAARADRRRAGRAPDLLLPPRGQVRVRRAAPARAPEPRARPARARRRGALGDGRARRDARPRLLRRDARPAREARDGDLQAAHGQVRLPGDDERQGDRAHAQPLRAAARPRGLVRVGADLDRDAIRTFRVSRIRGDIRFATRRERDFRRPPSSTSTPSAAAPPWQFGEPAGEARIEVPARDRVVGRARLRATAAALEDGVFVTEYASLPMLASWVLRQDGRAVPARAAPTCAARWRTSLRRVRDRHEGAPSKPAREVARAREPDVRRRAVVRARSRPSASACSRRCSPTCSPPAARTRTRSIPAADLVERFQIPYEELEDHLSLLNLVNFGGGCYAVYAELHDDEVHVDKELWGDTFRSAPRLTPLEARAIRLALEFVGPLIAAEAHRPLDRVRKKLEETFGEFELSQTPAAARRRRRGGPRRDADRRDPPPAARRARVPEGRGGHAHDAPRRALLDRAAAPALVRAHVGPHARRRAQLPARPDAQRDPHRRGVRAPRGIRARPPQRRARRPRPLLARRRALGGRARRARR